VGPTLAIDQGTSGTKSVVVDESGSILAIAEEAVRPRYLAGDGVEVDPEELWQSVLVSGRRAVAEAGVSISAVSLANQGETVLAWDRDTGQPLSAGVVWQDGRSRTVTDRLEEHRDEIAARTGLVLDPYFSAPKMRWIRENWTTDGVVTTSDTWLVHRLCGEFVTDVSTASRSLLLDIETTGWAGDLLEHFGLGDEELPRIAACDEVVGHTSVFGTSVPVCGLMVDQQAALLAQACLEPGTAKCTYGTGAFLLANVGSDALRSTAGLTTSVAWRMRDDVSYCVDGQVLTAASAVRWLVDLGLIDDASELDSVSTPDAGGVLAVPTFAGAAAPWWRSDATASFHGLTLSAERGHVVRALLEGIATQVAVLLRSVSADLGADVGVLRVDGGLTQSSVLMQSQADIGQTSVELYPNTHATALGAAAAARLSLDAGLTLEDAVGSWEPPQRYEPTWTADRAAEHVAGWTRALKATMPDGGPR
jgi:glycerol kinase